MFERIRYSFAMTGESWRVLRREPALLVYPLLSALVLGGVFGPAAARGHGMLAHGTLSVGLFLVYATTYLVSLFFNTALTHVVLRRLDGQPVGIAAGLAFAAARLPVLIGYALLAATVGMVLRLLEERLSIIGRLTGALLGATWTIATAMVVPVIAAEDVGPIDAIGRSLALMKDTWGENLVGRISLRIPITLILLALLFFWLPAFIALWTGHAHASTVPVLVATTLLFGLTVLAASALTAILGALLYRYARDGGADHRPADPLAEAFAAR